MKSKQIYTGVSTSFAFRQQLENPLYTYCKSETSGRYAAGISGTGSVWCGTDIPTSKKPSCPMTDTPSARELAGTWSVYELVEATPKLEDEFTPEQVRALEAWKRD